MHKNNFYIFFGAWVAVLPFTGIPGVWKNGLIFASGIFIILTVVGPSILRDLTKTKTVRRRQKVSNEALPAQVSEVVVEEKADFVQEGSADEVANNNQ